MKSTFKILIMILGAMCLCSCGYHMGSMMHPQIQTVAIADIVNETKEPLVIEIMRNKLAERFQVDGSMKLKSLEKADCIVHCRILSVNTHTIREDSDDGQETYRPTEFGITITAEFTVLVPGRSEPLIPLRKVSGRANYQYEADPQIGRIAGIKQAGNNLAALIVQYTTEAW